MRKHACLSVALATLVAVSTASVGVAGAAPGDDRTYVPTARAEDPDSPDDDERANRKNRKEENCPQEKWVIALPIEGLACVLLLPKPPPEGEGRDNDDGGGLLG